MNISNATMLAAAASSKDATPGDATGYIEIAGGAILALMGTIGVVWAGRLLIKKLMASQQSQGSWATVIFMSMISGAIMIGGFTLVSKNAKDRETSSPESKPEPAPPKPEPNQISLPEINNLGSLWLIPLAMIVALIIYLTIRHFRKEARLRKAQLAEQERITALINQRWQAVLDRHAGLRAKFLKAETDWDMLFDYPALQDVSIPQTARMVSAMNAANDIDKTQPIGLTQETTISNYAYPQAVEEFAIAWRIATEHARKIKQRAVPKEERKTIKHIRQLLRIAENAGSSDTERENAYAQAQKLIDELQFVTVPRKAAQAIERRQLLEIEAGAPSAREALLID